MSLKKIELQCNVNLKRYTSIKIGGWAKHFFIVHAIDDLRQIINDVGLLFYILGKGSNLLIADSLIQEPVVKLGEEFSYIREGGDYLEVGASTPLSFLIKYCLMNNLSGLENLAGIPATVGGLLIMNASSFGKDISSCLREVEVIDKEGNIKTLKKSEVIFGYRFSSLKDYVILGAKFNLLEKRYLKEEIKKILKVRLSSQDFNFPSCGSVFKNTERSRAGFLIDSCGLKGLRRGDAQVSSQHANFIVNLGSAKYKDVDYLIQKIKDGVYEKYRIVLQEEIERWT